MKKIHNKDNFVYDIILTLSLILSAILTTLIMNIIDVQNYETATSFIIIFILIKIFYNSGCKFYRNYKK